MCRQVVAKRSPKLPRPKIRRRSFNGSESAKSSACLRSCSAGLCGDLSHFGCWTNSLVYTSTLATRFPQRDYIHCVCMERLRFLVFRRRLRAIGSLISVKLWLTCGLRTASSVILHSLIASALCPPVPGCIVWSLKARTRTRNEVV